MVVELVELGGASLVRGNGEDRKVRLFKAAVARIRVVYLSWLSNSLSKARLLSPMFYHPRHRGPCI